ncbi:MAG: hypothetical protein R6W73_07450 [Candidatus Saliniplasma sp.]
MLHKNNSYEELASSDTKKLHLLISLTSSHYKEIESDIAALNKREDNLELHSLKCIEQSFNNKNHNNIAT